MGNKATGATKEESATYDVMQGNFSNYTALELASSKLATTNEDTKKINNDEQVETKEVDASTEKKHKQQTTAGALSVSLQALVDQKFITNEKAIEIMKLESPKDPLEMIQWQIPPEELNIGKRLGSGGCGWVYQGTYGSASSSVPIAYKEVMSGTIDPEDLAALAEFRHEARMMTQLNHPYIVKFYGICEKIENNERTCGYDEERKYMVIELAPGGSLEDIIEKAALAKKEGTPDMKIPIEKIQMIQWASQIAAGMSYMHSRGFIHRDIKPQNIVINGVGDALICDLGTVKNMDPNAPKFDVHVIDEYKAMELAAVAAANATPLMTQNVGTPLYMAPESNTDLFYTKAVDVWAYGVLLIRLCTLDWPYPRHTIQMNRLDLMKYVSRNELRPSDVDRRDLPHPDLKDVIDGCLKYRKDERFTFAQIEKRLARILKQMQETPDQSEYKNEVETNETKQETNKETEQEQLPKGLRLSSETALERALESSVERMARKGENYLEICNKVQVCIAPSSLSEDQKNLIEEIIQNEQMDQLSILRDEMNTGYENTMNEMKKGFKNAKQEIAELDFKITYHDRGFTERDLLEFSKIMEPLIVHIEEKTKMDEQQLLKICKAAQRVCVQVRRQLKIELEKTEPIKEKCQVFMQYGMQTVRGLILAHGVLQDHYSYSRHKLTKDMNSIYNGSDDTPGLADLVGQMICTPLISKNDQGQHDLHYLDKFESEMLALKFQRPFYAAFANKACYSNLVKASSPKAGSCKNEPVSMQEWNKKYSIKHNSSQRIATKSFTNISLILGSNFENHMAYILDVLQLGTKTTEIKEIDACLYRYYCVNLLEICSKDPSACQILGNSYEKCYQYENKRIKSSPCMQKALECYKRSWQAYESMKKPRFSEVLEVVRLPVFDPELVSRAKNEILIGSWGLDLFLLAPLEKKDQKRRSSFTDRIKKLRTQSSKDEISLRDAQSAGCEILYFEHIGDLGDGKGDLGFVDIPIAMIVGKNRGKKYGEKLENMKINRSQIVEKNEYKCDSKKYFGEMKGNKENGQGMCIINEPIKVKKYVGQWIDGKYNGHGTCSYVDGSNYVGRWADDKRHGHGTYTLAEGDTYVGHYADDKREIYGTYTWCSGNKYDGQWANGKINGSGVFTWRSGTKYDGQWEDNDRHGIGTKTLTNGDQYEGQWEKDTITGDGTYTYASGKIYIGKFKDGKKNGQGTETNADGTIVYTGEWVNDVPCSTSLNNITTTAPSTPTPTATSNTSPDFLMATDGTLFTIKNKRNKLQLTSTYK